MDREEFYWRWVVAWGIVEKRIKRVIQDFYGDYCWTLGLAFIGAYIIKINWETPCILLFWGIVLAIAGGYLKYFRNLKKQSGD